MVRCSVGGFVVAVLLYPAWCYGYSSSSFYSLTSDSYIAESYLTLGAEYPDCNGTRTWIGDGMCDVATNTPSCEYDGGDCCVCTCVDGLEYDCGISGFSCVDPDGVTAEKYGCAEIPPPVLPCSMGTQRPWVVDDTASAQALAEAMNCSGGVFDVAWYGNVIVESKFYAIDGTVLTIVGNGSSASVYGISDTGLFVVVNASLNAIGFNISHSGNTSGVIAAAGSSVVFSRTTFIDNNTTSSSGALTVSGGSSVSFSGETLFSGNSVVGSGGALFVSDGSSVSFAGDTFFVGNSAASGGGALFVSEGSNVLFTGDTLFSGNSANTDGGTLLVSDGSLVSFAGDTKLFDNTASYGGAMTVSNYSIVSFVGNTIFSNNTATEWGGVFRVITNSRIAFTGETNYSGNSVTYRGGVLFMTGNSSATWTGETTFEGNAQRSDTGQLPGGLGFGGGALYISRGSTMWWSGQMSFSNNSAEYGGAVLVNDGSSASWSGYTLFLDNNAEYGGAVFVNDGSSVSWIGNTDFVSNSAAFSGGAVGSIVYDSDLNAEESILIISDQTTFINNTSGVNGGGLALLGALNITFKEADVSFVGNYAGNAGGGLYLSGAGVGPVFSNVSFISNVAHLGGAVFAAGSGNEFRSDGEQKPTTFYGCRFIRNEATATGGAIDTAAGRDVIRDTLFMGNTAGVGGALRLAGTAYMSNCSFVDNISDVEGGTAVSNIGRVMQMDDNYFMGNIYNCEPGTFLDFNVSLGIFDTACDGCDLECTGCSYDEPPWAPSCTEVMEHATSPGGTITLDVLHIESGHWRATNSSRDILACYNVDACLGGVTETPNYCRQGYEGPYCSICSDGYVANLGFSCTKCVDSKGGVVLAVVLAVIVLVVAIVTISYLLSANMEDAGVGFVKRVRRCLPLQSIKIVVVVWQIITQFTSVANVAYPGVYQRFLNKVDVLNFDLGWMISAGCLVDIDFHDQLVISTLGPIGVMFSLGATYAIAVRLHKGSEDALRIVRHKHASMALLLTFLVYSSVSVILFQMYGCDKLDDGKNYLRADYRIECDSYKHGAFQVYAGLMIALYTVGIPAFYTGLLFRSRDVLKNSTGRENKLGAQLTSDLWKPYKPTRFYYEVIECARRMLLAGVVVFIYPNTAAQIAVTLIMAMFFVFVSEGSAPYELRWDCWVNRMGHAIVLASMYLALLLKVDVSGERASSQKGFEAVLVSAHALMVLTVVVEAVIMACKRRAPEETGPKVQSSFNWNKEECLDEGESCPPTHS